MIEIVAILAVLTLIGYLAERAKEHFGMGILGLIMWSIVFSLALPVVIVVGSVLLPIVIDNLPAVLICSVILVATCSIFIRKRRRSYVGWIERVGFGKQYDAPGNERIWNWAKKKEYTGYFAGYVWSVRFYNNVLDSFYARQVVTEEELQSLCIQAAPMFDPANTFEFLDCSKLLEILVPLDEPDGGTVYVANYILSDCVHLFEIQGCVTEKEFTQICKTEMGGIPVNPLTLAKSVLENMVSLGAASRVPLEEYQDEDALYVAKRKEDNCKMKRVEINLDD